MSNQRSMYIICPKTIFTTPQKKQKKNYPTHPSLLFSFCTYFAFINSIFILSFIFLPFSFTFPFFSALSTYPPPRVKWAQYSYLLVSGGVFSLCWTKSVWKIQNQQRFCSWPRSSASLSSQPPPRSVSLWIFMKFGTIVWPHKKVI